MSRILVIDDDEGIRANVLDLLEAEGYTPFGAADGNAGVALAMEQLPDLIVCDVSMQGLDGFEVFEILNLDPRTAVIPFVFLSARAERADVRRGMALGADDYLTKPFTRVELLETIRARLERRRPPSAPPASPSRAPLPPADGFGTEWPLVVADPAMHALFSQVDRVASSTLSVLVLGETGVGKEVIAERLHRASGRKGRLVAINCAALPETLLESELFGHEKGAFTGAVQSKEGLFESADGGTLFLDEVGELPPGTQAKLLRVLEDKKILRIGSRTARSLDVRFVSATNRRLSGEDGAVPFRSDLFYRLGAVLLEVPPLRDRAADIVPLAQRFASQSAHSLGRPRPPDISPAVIERLEAHSWPGNIRELRNVVQRAVLLCDGDRIDLGHLPAKFGAVPGSEPAPGAAEETASQEDPRVRLLAELDRLERARVVDALSRCAGNQTQAAALLGISRRTLVARLGDYGLPRPRKRPT